jgi:hypothetical protein
MGTAPTPTLALQSGEIEATPLAPIQTLTISMRTRSMRMDELREAVSALAAEAHALETQMAAMGDVPAQGRLDDLQKGVDRIQRGLNWMQTALDTSAGETERV